MLLKNCTKKEEALWTNWFKTEVTKVIRFNQMNFNTTFANLNPGFADSEYSDLLRFLFYCMAKLETCPYVQGILKKCHEIDYFFRKNFCIKHTQVA